MRDYDIISRPASWPQWPFLPVKRFVYGKLPDCGVLTDSVHPCRVYLVNLFNLPDDLEASPALDYHNVDELLADGWRVD